MSLISSRVRLSVCDVYTLSAVRMNSSLKSRLFWRNDQPPNFVVCGIVGMWVAVADGSDDDNWERKKELT